MKEKMTWSGIGVKMAVFSLPYFILTVIWMALKPEFLQMRFLSPVAGYIIGGILIAGGLVFLGFTVPVLLEGLKKQKLLTSGVYGLTRNPVYACWILFLIPGLAFFFLSWLLLFGTAVLYINFKLLIGEEVKVLKSNFGKKYSEYESRVNELLPLPKWDALKKKK
jgi:protein-S-isoprenylcysteine O-methyltransferase Ste14